MSGSFELGPTTIEATAAVGGAWVPWVGPGADVLLLDPIALTGVRVTPAAVGVEVQTPYGGVVEGRVEQGVVHGAELELAEAHVGWMESHGIVGGGIGRSHVPYSHDRRFEQEDLALPFRPLLSRIGLLPLHATGFDGALAWPGRGSLVGGAFWASATADAPHLWARLDLFPLGLLPDREDGDSDGLRLAAGAGIVVRDSPIQGRDRTVSVDGGFTWRAAGLDGGWILQDQAGDTSVDEWVAGRSRVVRFPGASDLFAAARVERVSGIVDGETWRTIGLGRLSLRTPGAWAAFYVEGSVSREAGPGTGGDGDVVDLARAERSNDWIGTGVWARW